jgi:transaldolase
MSTLESLKKNTIIVADTGDINRIRELKPQDATTNPSLILQVASNPEYDHIVNHCIAEARSQPENEQLEFAMDLLLVTFGREIVKVLPENGYISSEVDARLSFDTVGTIARAKKVIAMYEAEGVPKSRVLIKIASTWEGIQAARALEKEGITCNLTLLFSKAQAIACAQAGVKLISPFVGRILDYYKAKGGMEFNEDGSNDPGVVFVTQVWELYKKYNYNTIVMGASFRNIGEIMQLNGCDRLTISPALLLQLQERQGELELKLDPKKVEISPTPLDELTEAQYRWMFNQDAMANEKLSQGIVAFANDIEKLEKIVQSKLAQ